MEDHRRWHVRDSLCSVEGFDGMLQFLRGHHNLTVCSLVQLEGNAQPCFAANLLSGAENVENMASLDELFLRVTGTVFAGMHLLCMVISYLDVSALCSWVGHGE